MAAQQNKIPKHLRNNPEFMEAYEAEIQYQNLEAELSWKEYDKETDEKIKNQLYALIYQDTPMGRMFTH